MFSSRKLSISVSVTLMLLNMEKKIAETADREQIRGAPVRRSDDIALVHQVLAASAYLVRRRPITLFGDGLPYPNDIAPRDLAVEAEQHEPAGAKQGQESAPSRPGIGEMVEDAAGRR